MTLDGTEQRNIKEDYSIIMLVKNQFEGVAPFTNNDVGSLCIGTKDIGIVSYRHKKALFFSTLKNDLNKAVSTYHYDLPDNKNKCEQKLISLSGSSLSTPPTQTIINQRYLGGQLAKIINGTEKFFNIKSIYGTGKTYAIKKYISWFTNEYENPPSILYITAGRKLNKATSIDLGIGYYEDDNYGNSVATTIQSLYKAPSKKYDLIILDESEQSIADLVSSLNKKKIENINALESLLNKAGNVFFMDAMLGENTKFLQNIFNITPHTLINNYSPWKDIPTTIIDGGKFGDRVESCFDKILNDIKKGLRVYIACGSKALTIKISLLIKEKEGAECLLFNSETADMEKQRAVICNPSLSDKEQILIASPVIASGISFDSEKFDVTYGIFSNSKDTATPELAVQQIARARKTDRLVLVLDNDKSVYSDETTISTDVFEALLSIAKVNGREPTNEDKKLIDIYAGIEANQRNSKDNFNKVFTSTLDEMGLAVTFEDVTQSSAETNHLKTSNALSKTEIRKQQKIIATAPKVTDAEADILKEERRTRTNLIGEKLTKEEVSSIDLRLERYSYESSMMCDFDSLQGDEITEIFANRGKYLSKARKRCMIKAPQAFDKKYINNVLKKADMVDERQRYVIDKKIHKFAMKVADKGEYTTKSLVTNPNGTKTAFYRYISAHKKTINILFPKMISHDFKDKPEKLMRKLLNNLGYSSRKNSKKKYIEVLTDPSLEAFIEKQIKNKKDWVTFADENMKIVDEAKKVATSIVLKSERTKRAKTELNAYLRSEIDMICKIVDIPFLTPPQTQPIAKIIVSNRGAYKALNMRKYLAKNSLDSFINLIRKSL